MLKNLKIRKTLLIVFKLTLFVLVSYFLFLQIRKIQLSDWTNVKLEHPLWLFFVVLLFFVNWGLELLKWKLILNINQIPYSVKQIYQSLIAGISTGLATPNRLGNFIGRIVYFKGKNRAQIIMGTLYGNFSQFLATLLLGVPPFLLYYAIVFPNADKSVYYFSLVLLIVSLFFYFLIPFIPIPSKIDTVYRKKNILRTFQGKSKRMTFPLITFSSLRFLAFSMQYLLLLMTFGVKLSNDLFLAVFMFYFISSVIPSFMTSKLLLRETIGLIVLGVFVDNPAVIVVSSLLLWLVNLGIPSLLGMYFVLKHKILSE